jgi:hypothetical protein
MDFNFFGKTKFQRSHSVKDLSKIKTADPAKILGKKIKVVNKIERKVRYETPLIARQIEMGAKQARIKTRRKGSTLIIG